MLMRNSNSINFFEEKNSSKLNIINIISTVLIVIVIIVNFLKVYEVNKLEDEVNQSKENISLEKEDELVKTNGVEVSELKKSIELILDNNINDIEFKNNKIKLIGVSPEINKVNNYVEILKSNNSVKNCNINSINRQNEVYQFEIDAYIGEINNNEI